MPFHDLVQQHFQTTDVQAIDTAIDLLEKALTDKKRNLSPEERKRYGSINEANKLLVNKVYDYCKAQPDFCSPDNELRQFFQRTTVTTPLIKSNWRPLITVKPFGFD